MGFTSPRPDEEQTLRLQAACQDGGVSFHAGGIHPGFAGDLFALIGSRLHSRLDTRWS